MGLGYVGLPLAVVAAKAGFDVLGFDVDPRRVAELAAGRSPIEDVVDDEVVTMLATGSFSVTADPASLAGAEVVVIAVPTPLRDGEPDLRAVESAGRILSPHIRAGMTVVLESTSYPGTTEQVLGPLLAESTGLVPGADFRFGFSPERIDPGNKEWHVSNTPKLVSGVDAKSRNAIEEFYSAFVKVVVPVSSVRDAEFAKIIENSFRSVNISLVNELAMVAAELGLDIHSALDAAATKPFGFMRFQPGPGVGGHCLPVDPRYLAHLSRSTAGKAIRTLELAGEVNEEMPGYVARRVVAGLARSGTEVEGSRILVLGAAYKPNSGDLRHSPAMTVAALLAEAGARIRVVDPHVDPGAVGFPLVRLDAGEAGKADAVVLLTDHDAFDYSPLDAAPYVFDTRGVLHGANVERL
ncbi:nucleotide sugar dehydrogenase [Amycolatopsis sp. VS8301801F10]|uniref:nucleotide sugar dehydrogenase n=1 Tax=Amycolatopsis sp. VS8301801F10 TaxID=2652442 RepID=UPI0038FC7870